MCNPALRPQYKQRYWRFGKGGNSDATCRQFNSKPSTHGNHANATPRRRGQQNWQCSASQFRTKATGKYTAANMDERRGVRSLKETDSRNTKPNINSVSTELQPPSSEKIAINADDSSQIATHLVPRKLLNIDKIVTNRNDSCQYEGIRIF
jgi:hypothetical protein